MTSSPAEVQPIIKALVKFPAPTKPTVIDIVSTVETLADITGRRNSQGYCIRVWVDR